MSGHHLINPNTIPRGCVTIRWITLPAVLPDWVVLTCATGELNVHKPESSSVGVIVDEEVVMTGSDSSETETDAQESVHKAFRADEYGGEPGSTPPVSKEEREGVPPTDTTAATPLGVGESTGGRGEELGGKEAGREDIEPQGDTQRPAGVSTGRDVTGVNPSKGQRHESDVTDD
jgi:hypothetical protein